MKNNKIVLENKNEVRKGMPEADILKNMEALGFECILNAKKHSKYSNTSRLYLFIKHDISLCQIETYEGKVSNIDLIVNYQNKNSDDSPTNFSNTTWGSSTGTASGYGYHLKVGSLSVHGNLEETLEEMKRKGRFVFPLVERYFHLSEDIFSQQEKDNNPLLTDTIERTQWFIDNKIKESDKKFFGPQKTDEHQEKMEQLMYWNNYIRWNYKFLNKDKVDKQDKKFYTICKDIILKDIEEIKTLIDKNFLYQTTSLGQNFCHLMSVVQEPAKKELLWNNFMSLSPSHQANFICQNDVNGYNPLLMLAQHQGIRLIKDNELNLEYFNKYLSIQGIEAAFSNDRNSLFDCLLYGGSLDANKTINYLTKILDNGLEIPMTYLKKERPFTSGQKVVEKFEGEKVKPHLNDYVFNFINAVNLNKKISSDLPQKEIDNTKLKKI